MLDEHDLARAAVEADPKPQVRSLTQWLNGLATLVAVMQMAVDGGVIPPQYLPHAVTGLGVANMLIRRFKTEGPVRGVVAKKK